MPLNAKFTADFTSFYDACQKAEIKLTAFETGAARAESALKAAANSLSGARLIQDAIASARAVEELGGVSILTQAELGQLRDRAGEAVEKLKALGKDVPPELQKLAEAADKPVPPFERLGDAIEHPSETLKSLAANALAAIGPLGALATMVAGAAGGIVEFVRSSAEVGGRLNDMSEKTGIAVPRLSGLKYAAEVAGSSIDDVSNAVFMLERRMAESPASMKQVHEGLDRLGIDFAQFDALSPDEKYLAISDSIKTIEDPTQKAAAMTELFGKSGREQLPIVSKNLRELVDEGMRLDTWTEQESQAAEQLEMSLKALSLSVTAVGTAIGRDLIPETQEAIDDLRDLLQLANEIRARGGLGITAATINPGRTGEQLARENALAAKSLDELAAGTFKYEQASGNATRANQKYFDSLRPIQLAAPSMADAFSEMAISSHRLDFELKDSEDAHKKQADAMKKAKEEGEYMGKVFDELFIKQGQAVNGAKQWVTTGTLVADRSKAAAERIGDLSYSLEQVRDQTVRWVDAGNGVTAMLGPLLPNVHAFNTEILNSAKSFGTFHEAMRNTLDQIPTLLAQAFTGGGGWTGAVQAIGSVLGTQLGNAIGENVRKAIVAKGGSEATAGFAASAVSAGTSAALSFGIGLLVDYAKARQAAADQEAAFVQALADQFRTTATHQERLTVGMGAWEQATAQVAKTYRLLGIDSTKALTDVANQSHLIAERTATLQQQIAAVDQSLSMLEQQVRAVGRVPDALQPLIQQLIESGRLTDAETAKLKALATGGIQDFSNLRSIAQKYGGTLEQLGGSLAGDAMHESFQELYSDMQVLQNAGGDANAILQLTKQKLLDLAGQAVKFGLQVPKEFQPYIQQLLDAGEYIDDNKDGINDLTQVEFGGSPLITALDGLKQTLDDLVQTLKDMKEKADDAALAIGRIPHAGAPEIGTAVPRGTAPSVVGSNVIAFPGARTSGGAGPATITVQLVADGRVLAETIVPEIPGVVQRYGIAS